MQEDRGRLWRRLTGRAPGVLGLAVVAAGLLTGSIGVMVAVAASSPALAAGLNACGGSLQMVPGDHGTCTQIVTDNTSPRYGGNVNVTVVVTTTSTSGGGSPAASPLVGTEALLDGSPTGLQIARIEDETTGTIVDLGPIQCFTNSSMTVPVSPKTMTAGFCESRSTAQLVASDVSNSGFSNQFEVFWYFPIAAGNPYQGSSASVNITASFTGSTTSSQATPPPSHSPQPTPTTTPSPTPTATPTATPTPTPSGAVLGSHTTPSPKPPGKHGGVLGASAPTTGAELPVYLSRVLIVLGLALVFGGLVLWRRQRYYQGG